MEEKPKARSWPMYFGIGLLLLVAYPLSAGPTIWLFQHGMLHNQVATFLEYFYAPLGWLAEHRTPPLGPMLDWYFERWR